ncbi:PREDICTED: proactivator polypeptide-like, partial [Buceros rhinoceros silvestris]|uniref:proactivator polypeptide-like n=1 Tax=Buceros rhinoceros silvestris TaxID=175836 RepID=UPI00052814B2
MESKWSGWVLILSVCLGCYRAGASPLHECSERPEDWCRDVVTAAKCGTLELCQATVWNQAPGQKRIPCHLCQVAVSAVGKILQDNCTEEKLRRFLDKKCQYLPFQDWSVKCKRMVDTGILILTQLGKQALSNPKVVCGTIKLCQPRESSTGALKFQETPLGPVSPAQDFADLVAPFIANVPLLLHPQDLPRGEEMEEVCGVCLQRVSAVQLELGTSSAFTQTLVAHGGRMCEGLAPDLAQQCNRSLAEYADMAAQLLRYMDPMELCGQLGLCSSASALPLHTLLTEKVTQVLSTFG